MRSRKWTVRRVGELIERECRVRYCAAGAWGVLRGMGWKWRGGGRGWKRAPFDPRSSFPFYDGACPSLRVFCSGADGVVKMAAL